MSKSYLLIVCLLLASFTGCIEEEIEILEEKEEVIEEEAESPPFIVSGWDDGAPEGYSLTSHTVMYEEASSTPNGECYDLAKSSLGAWSIVNLANDWIIDGYGYGNSVYERDTENVSKPHDTLYKLDSFECKSEEEELAGGCFECDCKQNSGGYWGEYSECTIRPRDECGNYCVMCDADANFIGHTCPEPESEEEEEVCDASQITNVEVLPSSIYPGSFQMTWNYPDVCVSEEQEGDYWEQRTEYLPPGNGWHAGGGYGERLGNDTWGYDHPNYWLGATDCERSGHIINITIRINSEYRVDSSIENYTSGPHTGYMSMADCSEEEVEGCMDPDAINYDSTAEIDDGSCEYPPVVCELVPYGHCSGENFSGQDLSYLNLTGIDLSYTNLAGANLGFTNLAFADLSYANLSYVKGETMWEATKLLYANLSYANLRHANLHSTIINYANLEGADISYANGYSTKFNEAYMADAILNYTKLQWPQFAWVDLSGANFNEAYLDHPFLSEADLSYADFTDAIVTDGNFINTTWYHTIWTDGIVYDEDPTIVEECELVPYGHCSGADFSGQDLSGMNLTGIDLSYADLTDANLTDTTLSGANIGYADLSDANFEDADLSNAYLGYADLIYTYLRYADLTGANLEGADLYRAAFDHVDMAGANLTYAELSWASFWGANLASANLESITTHSGKALFQYADLSGTNLINADLSNATLYDADLTDTNLESADLSGAWLEQADLTGAYLVGANLTYADFEYTTVTDADFTDTIWYQTIWTDGETYDENQAD